MSLEISVEKLLKNQTFIALLYFLLLGVLGWFLRANTFISMPISYGNLLHTHSHLALLGWIYFAISILVFKWFISDLLRVFRIVFWCTQISILGMLFTFPFMGYALWSIVFSTLFLFVSYYFSWLVIRKTPFHLQKNISFQLIKWGLRFLVISSIGPWALGIIMNTLGSDSSWYQNAIYFYMHFLSNGFFVLAILGLFFRYLEQCVVKGIIENKKIIFLNVVAVVFTLPLSFLWERNSLYHFYYQLLGGIGLIFQFWAVFIFFQIIIKNLHADKRKLKLFDSQILSFLGILFILKNILQAVGLLPEMGLFVNNNKNLIIAYLHLVFLGIISPFVMFLFQKMRFIFLNKNHWIIYFIAFIFTETVIAIKGLGQLFFWEINFQTINQYLFVATTLLVLSILWIVISQIPIIKSRLINK